MINLALDSGFRFKKHDHVFVVINFTFDFCHGFLELLPMHPRYLDVDVVIVYNAIATEWSITIISLRTYSAMMVAIKYFGLKVPMGSAGMVKCISKIEPVDLILNDRWMAFRDSHIQVARQVEEVHEM